LGQYSDISFNAWPVSWMHPLFFLINKNKTQRKEEKPKTFLHYETLYKKKK
jgi:hypothetical protein